MAYQSRIVVNFNTIAVKVWIIIPIQHLTSRANRFKAFLWSCSAVFNHLGSLIGIQFVRVTLVWDDTAHFHWKLSIPVGRDKWQIPIFKTDVVLSLEILVDTDIRLFGVWICPVDIIKLDILGMATLATIRSIELETLDRIRF